MIPVSKKIFIDDADIVVKQKKCLSEIVEKLEQYGAEKGLKSLLYYLGVSRKKLLSHSVVALVSFVGITIKYKTLIFG